MNVSSELLTAVSAKTPGLYLGPHVSKRVIECIEYIEKIRSAQAVVKADFNAEKDRHNKALAELEQRMRGVEQRCPHPLKHSNPSGESDFWCELCGASI